MGINMEDSILGSIYNYIIIISIYSYMVSASFGLFFAGGKELKGS